MNVALLSSMYSTLYNVGTLDDEGGFRELSLEPEPGRLAGLIPPDYWDTPDRALPLWAFKVRAATSSEGGGV
jgi:hypothetical protein